MKLKYIIIGLIIVIIGVCCYLILGNKKRIKDEELDSVRSFYMTYSNGYMINAYTRYQLNIKDDKYIAEIKPYGVAEEDKLEIEVEKKVLDEITEVLKKYHVSKWDGFNKSDHGVLDGDSFSLSIYLNDDKSIQASGYMMWPENYRNVRDEISEIFMKIYNQEKKIEN